jgi:predicted dienelactone hydrolase
VSGYDPFTRGAFPAGVRTLHLVDRARDERSLPVELWYPASDAHAGRDVSPATRDTYDLIPGLPPTWQDALRDATPRDGRFPLVFFSHGYGGHRRQSTFLCTHLASHGYLVAAVDHTGNTVLDVFLAVMRMLQTEGAAVDVTAPLRESIVARPADVRFVLDQLLDGGAGELGARIDAERIGMAGHSFGGWTTIMATARDRRIRAALPLAPAGGSSPLPAGPLIEALDFGWGREVPTLFLVADRDTLLPLAGMHELYARTPSSSKRMVILENADHMHFCDRVEEIHEVFRTMPNDPVFAPIQQAVPPIGELCAGEAANTVVRGLGLAHMDAHLRGDESAARFLADDLAAALRARSLAIAVV